jgi:hypothetical protein
MSLMLAWSELGSRSHDRRRVQDLIQQIVMTVQQIVMIVQCRILYACTTITIYCITLHYVNLYMHFTIGLFTICARVIKLKC